MLEQRHKIAWYAAALLVAGALARFPTMILLRHMPIYVYADLSYSQAAQNILRLNFHAFGDRPPLYPLLVALCGLNPHWVWFAQSILGITASLMIFDMAFHRTRHGLFSLLVGLACSLTPEVLVYESSLMTEALANFLLVASFWLITRREAAGERTIRYPLELGSIVALAGLTRPLMICLVPVYYCFLVPWPPARILQREARKRTLFFVLPVIVLILGWCGFNYLNSGYFSPTTRAGEHLMAQVDPLVRLAPERFAVLRDTWLEARRQVGGNPNKNASLVYGGALRVLETRTGETEAQISRKYQSLALYLQIHHPLLYLRRAEQSWIEFWGEPTLDEMEWPETSNVTLNEFMMTLANFFVREVEALFLVLALFSLPCALIRRTAFTRLEYLIFAIALWASIFAAFAEYGENRRYCVPLYMLIVYTLMTRVWVWVSAAPSESSGRVPA